MVWFIVAIFTNIFQCRPFRAAFDPELLPTKQCINTEVFLRGVTASNLCIDVVMLYMPLHMVWRLRLAVRQKVALSGIFLMGTVWDASNRRQYVYSLINHSVCLAAAMRIIRVGNIQDEDLTRKSPLVAFSSQSQ